MESQNEHFGQPNTLFLVQKLPGAMGLSKSGSKFIKKEHLPGPKLEGIVQQPTGPSTQDIPGPRASLRVCKVFSIQCHWPSVQFSSVAQFSCSVTLCDSMDCSKPGLPVHHHWPWCGVISGELQGAELHVPDWRNAVTACTLTHRVSSFREVS